MASDKLSKVTPIPQHITGQVDRAEAVPDLAGLAGYLATVSQSTHDRFEFLKVEEMAEAERRVLEGVRVLVNAEAELRLSRWIRSHPNRKDWVEKPERAPKNALFHTPAQRAVIRRAYEHFGCDGCGTKERPHASDGLCARCYQKRHARRMEASMRLKVEEALQQKRRD